MHTRNMKLALALVLAVCAGRLPAWAQSTSTGTVAGVITDQSGAVVPDAAVRLTDTTTNIARTTTTNKDGRYIFVDVTPSVYNIAITKKGFSTTEAEKQEVSVGASLTLNLSLQVGGASTVVEVQATGTELQTTNATVGNTVTAIAIDNLPSIGRDVNTFIEMQPGVSAGGDVAGAVNDQSYFSLDGGNNRGMFSNDSKLRHRPSNHVRCGRLSRRCAGDACPKINFRKRCLGEVNFGNKRLVRAHESSRPRV